MNQGPTKFFAAYEQNFSAGSCLQNLCMILSLYNTMKAFYFDKRRLIREKIKGNLAIFKSELNKQHFTHED